MAIALVLALIRGEPVPAPVDLGWSVVGGALGVLGITTLYRALAVGRMGIVAPVTGVLAAIVPVTAGIVLEGRPAPIVLLGIALAIGSVVLVTRADDGGTGRAGLDLAVVAGLSIGAFDVVLAQISDGSVFGPLTVIRATEGLLIVGVVLVTRAAWRPPGSLVPGIVGVGAADMAGNAGFILAVQTGALAVASVLSSLYPVATIILAAAVLREPVTRSHAAGIALAVLAIVLIGLGSA